MQIDRVNVVTEHAFLSSALQNLIQPSNDGGIQLPELGGLLQMTTVMDVFDADETDEVRIVLVVIEGRLDQAMQRLAGIAAVDIELIFKGADAAIGRRQHCQVELLLAAEVIVDHPLRG